MPQSARSIFRFPLPLILAALLCPALPCNAQNVDSDDRTARWERDLDLVATELPRRHKDLFFRLSEDDFHSSLADIRSRISELSDPELQLELCRLVASVGDGHTRVNINPRDFTFLPVRFQLFRDGLYVTEATEGFSHLLGGRVVEINESDVSAIFQQVATVIAHDNASFLDYVVPYYMNMATILDFVHVTDRQHPLRLTLMDSDGHLTDAELPRLSASEIDEASWKSAQSEKALYERREGDNIWTEWLPESKTLYLKYRRCSGTLAVMYACSEAMEFAKANPVERLVVDMRWNGGGNSALLQPLLLALQESRFNHPQRLYVVIGRRTFSSAVLNTIDFKQRTEATLVGLPTGGKPNHYGEVQTLTLPESNLSLSYSTKYYTHYDDGDPDSIVPDVILEPTFADWSRGHDAVLDYIMNQPLPKEATERDD